MNDRSNVGRILTLVIEITDDNISEWIWENMKGNRSQGIEVFCIHEGDIFKQYDHFFRNDLGFDEDKYDI